MRKIHQITLGSIDNGERVKAIDIISKALAKDFGKECIVVQEGHMSDCALEAIPSSVCVFVISKERVIDVTTSEHHEPEFIVNPTAP